MSIASEISRLQTAKANLKTSIEGKGVTVPSSTTLDGYPALVDDIPTGGGGFNALSYVKQANGLLSDVLGPENVVLDFDGNTILSSLSSLGFRGSGVKNITIKNLVRDTTILDMSSFFYLHSALETITFENSSFTPHTLESFCRNATKIKTIVGEIDCTRCTGVNSLNYWFDGNGLIIEDFRIKPNTIGHSPGGSMCGKSTSITNATYISIANGLDPNVTGQTIKFTSSQLSVVQTIMGTNDNGTFVADSSGSLSLDNFITNVKGWTIAT